jgi:hypothetical protein
VKALRFHSPIASCHNIFFPPRLEVVVEQQNPHGLPSHSGNQSPRKRARPFLQTPSLRLQKQGSRATAAVDLNYASRFGSHSEPVALLTNQFLRDLGYAVNLADLRSLL